MCGDDSSQVAERQKKPHGNFTPADRDARTFRYFEETPLNPSAPYCRVVQRVLEGP